MALLTDVLAALMVTLAVVGMLAVALRAREYGMITAGDGVVVGLGAALSVAMTATVLL